VTIGKQRPNLDASVLDEIFGDIGPAKPTKALRPVVDLDVDLGDAVPGGKVQFQANTEDVPAPVEKIPYR